MRLSRLINQNAASRSTPIKTTMLILSMVSTWFNHSNSIAPLIVRVHSIARQLGVSQKQYLILINDYSADMQAHLLGSG